MTEISETEADKPRIQLLSEYDLGNGKMLAARSLGTVQPADGFTEEGEIHAEFDDVPEDSFYLLEEGEGVVWEYTGQTKGEEEPQPS